VKCRGLVVLACAAALFGAGGHSASAYPPSPRTVAATPNVGRPAYTVTVTADCSIGERVTIRLESQAAEVPCSRSQPSGLVENPSGLGGRATARLTAPVTPSNYRGIAAGSASGDLGAFTITVQDVVGPGEQSLSGTFDSSSPFRWWPIAAAIALALAIAFTQYLEWGPRRLRGRR
jgi:hypothetical protein